MATVTQQIARDEKLSSKGQSWPLPFNISLETLELIIRGFFQAGGDSQPISAADLSKTTGLNATTVKSNCRFLVAFGILHQTDGQKYSLTQKGSDYVKSISSGDGVHTSALIKELTANSPLRDLQGFIELRGAGQLSYEQLFAHIRTMARLPENPKYPRGIAGPYVTGINTLIDLFVKGQILPADFRTAKIDIEPGGTPRKAGSTAKSMIQKERARPFPESNTSTDFAELRSDDFLFRVRRNANAIAFAKSQFAAWLDYLAKKESTAENPDATP
jgi:predicted transcriptional regulator